MINNVNDSECVKLNINSPVKRHNVINFLISKYRYKKYLEIGVFDGFTFKNIQCELKHGVDPGAEGYISELVTHNMTSDEFFGSNDHTYDLIFIDGLHHYEQVVKDINNSLKYISDSGYILLHDCNPCDEISQIIPRQTVVWNGDVWKAWLLFRRANPNAECFVLDTDFGIGVIKFSKDLKSIDSLDINLTYQQFEISKAELLNLKSCQNKEQLKGIL